MFTKNKNLIDDPESMVDVVEHDNGDSILITIIFHNSIYKKHINHLIELYSSDIKCKHTKLIWLNAKNFIECFHIEEAYHLANDDCISFEINKNYKSKKTTFDNLYDYAVNGNWYVVWRTESGVISSVDLIEK